MPELRLKKARESLPSGYRFGDAGPTTGLLETMRRRFTRCVPLWIEQERIREREEREYAGDRWPDEIIAMRCR